MEYIVSNEEISIIIFFLKYFFMNIGSYYIFKRLINDKKISVYNVIAVVFITISTIVYTKIQEISTPLDSTILMLVILVIIFSHSTQKPIGYTIIMTIFSECISNIIFFVATVINGVPNIVLNIKDDNITFIFIILVYFLLLYGIMKMKRLKNGFLFINKKTQNELFDVLILNISSIILFSIEIFGNYTVLKVERIGSCITILSIIMYLTIKKSFQVYYKQKLLMKQLEEADNEIINKQKEIEKLEQENLNFSKKSHSMAHKQRALEYKLNHLLMKEETSKELEIKTEIEKLSKELYQIPIEDLPSTEITQIDDMLEFMQSECVKNKIDFNLQIIGNVYHIINNIITVEQLEILIADHIKDAIIAIKHTDNINKSILVKLGKINECYGLYIYDSGIEFEKETLENLGKKPSTTHKDEGGTGMGFMNTFDTLNECKGSLIIKEIGKPSKDNFTKIIMIKFDGKNEYKVESYR